MLIGSPPEGSIKVYPCDRKDCYNYREWGLLPAKHTHIVVKPLRSFDCECCEHFKGFNVFRARVEENEK